MFFFYYLLTVHILFTLFGGVKKILSSCVLSIGCDAVEVTSNGRAQPTVMGVYQNENYLEKGKFVFKHQDTEVFLYWVSDGKWMVLIILL